MTHSGSQARQVRSGEGVRAISGRGRTVTLHPPPRPFGPAGSLTPWRTAPPCVLADGIRTEYLWFRRQVHDGSTT